MSGSGFFDSIGDFLQGAGDAAATVIQARNDGKKVEVPAAAPEAAQPPGEPVNLIADNKTLIAGGLAVVAVIIAFTVFNKK